jgi:hypothetical protein
MKKKCIELMGEWNDAENDIMELKERGVGKNSCSRVFTGLSDSGKCVEFS